ncbi:hypothetical protein MSAN_02087900 [Mycena sanguinolenta]|uniref:Uncharacterized protein n=1 Tax=Mycena sanguinolenta TaxID=230812 RepID=A0A8H7CM56_9AGAR|nr:hypothetical protein MSAN_02087900 [Mycena sanguinolenta]
MPTAPPTAVVLDQLQSALKIVTSLCNGALAVPGLGAAAGAAIEIIEIAQNVTKNKEDALEVAKITAERTSALLDAFNGKSKDEIPEYLLKSIMHYAEKLEVVRKILAKLTTQTRFWQLVSRRSNRDDINTCKDILNESFQVFQLSLSLRLHTRWTDLVSQINSVIVAQTKAVAPNLSIIRREELHFNRYWRLDGNTSIVSAEYNGRSVVVKKYGKDKTRWLADLDAWLDSDAWQPHYLQIIGQSDESARCLHLVFQDPGVPVQTFIERRCRENVKECTLHVLTMVIQFASVAIGLLSQDQGGCKIETADIYVRLPNSNAVIDPNFVLANFEPFHFYDPAANPSKIQADGWRTFVNLIAKAIIGNISRPNYVTGRHGDTGPTATRMFRFLIHFLADFPYLQDHEHDRLDEMFKKLTRETQATQKTVEHLDVPENSNPLLDSLQHYSSSLCALWDLWDILPVSPGDLGVMLPGDDPRCPRFQKIANVAEEMNKWLADQGKIQPVSTTFPEFSDSERRYSPPDRWSSTAVDATTMLHSLRLGDAPSTIPHFTYSRARRLCLLGKSFNYDATWNYLRHLRDTGDLLDLATEHNVHISDLILIFSTSESKGYTHLVFETFERRERLLREVGAKDGVLHYFENLAPSEGELYGYWSASDKPGNPLFGPFPRVPGAEWGWEYSDDGFKTEIGRKGPAQHIRYVAL